MLCVAYYFEMIDTIARRVAIACGGPRHQALEEDGSLGLRPRGGGDYRRAASAQKRTLVPYVLPEVTV